MRGIRRGFSRIDPPLFKRLYSTFVRPHLEFSVQAWRPWLTKNIKVLKHVQQRSAKLVNGLKYLAHVERRKILNIPSVSSRMDRADLILVYKVLNNLVPGLRKESLFRPATTAGLRGHSLKLFKESIRRDARKAAFSQRVVNNWNKLPADVVLASSVGVFKNRLDATWSALFPDNT